MICLLPWTDPKPRKGAYPSMLRSSAFPDLESGGVGDGTTSWTNIIIIYNKNHALFMAESRLSRFQTAGKAKLPDAVFFFFIIKHPTLCFWKSWQGKKVNIWALRRRSALWRWPVDSRSPCTELYSFQCVFPHALSSALTPAVLCLPCGLFGGADGDGCRVAGRYWLLLLRSPFYRWRH